MKNILNTKTDGTPALLSNVDEAGNSLYVNGTEISSSEWIGEGTYTFTVGSHTYTISKAPDNDGNYQLLKVSDYTYQFVKIVSKSIREELDDIKTALSSLESDAVTKSAGGQITGGGLSFTSGGMPQQTTGSGVAMTMDTFANGGQLKWQNWDNVTVGKAKDSDKLDGAVADDSATNSTIAKRTSSGYIYAKYFNASNDNQETMTTSSSALYCNSDGFIRKCTMANMRTALELGSLATMSNCNKVTSNGSGNKTAGYLVHGVGTGHDYALEWTSSQSLKFWVDTVNVTSLSDKRLKSEIQDVDMRLVKAIGECKTYQYKAFNRGGNISVGIMAQELVKKCKKYGVDPMAYELLSQMEFIEGDDTLYYHIEYEQYLALKCLYLEIKISELEAKIGG